MNSIASTLAPQNPMIFTIVRNIQNPFLQRKTNKPVGIPMVQVIVVIICVLQFNNTLLGKICHGNRGGTLIYQIILHKYFVLGIEVAQLSILTHKSLCADLKG